MFEVIYRLSLGLFLAFMLALPFFSYGWGGLIPLAIGLAVGLASWGISRIPTEPPSPPL